MLKIQYCLSDSDRWPEADFALSPYHGCPMMDGDVTTFCANLPSKGRAEALALPDTLTDQLKQWPPGSTAGVASDTSGGRVRIMVGNATGCELSYRHIYGGNAKKNIHAIMRWARWAYRLLGRRLVLAPMDYDLMHDIMTGSNLLRWSADRKIPLIIFCGYRLMFKPDAFEHIESNFKCWPLHEFANPYCWPFAEISQAIRKNRAEVWTGAGFEEGVRHGALEKAEQFGFKGVLTTKDAWISGLAAA